MKKYELKELNPKELNEKLLTWAGLYIKSPLNFTGEPEDCFYWLIPLLKPYCIWELTSCEEGYLFSLSSIFNPDKPHIDINIREETVAMAIAKAIGILIDEIDKFNKENKE